MALKINFEGARGQNYPRIRYKWWYALAEFVDNSTQSYFDNRDLLDEQLEKTGETFKVEIVRDTDLVRISDNAFGMDMNTLERAFEVSTPPPIPEGKSRHGRSRYGVGMKTASGWAGNNMTIRTTMLGSGEEITVNVDWRKINAGDLNLNEKIRTKGIKKTDHGTVIDLTSLHDPAKGRTVSTMKTYLSSIYRIDIRDKDMCLMWDGSPLKAFSFESNFFQKKPDNTPWKKEIDKKLNGKRIKGWFGVLKKGKAGRTKAGFSIFHNKRMIQGYPESWRPYEIYGDASNNLINQRLVGEIHLDDFDVTHTKDAIYWRSREEERLGQDLKERLDDLIEQAKIPYKDQGGGSKAQMKTFKQAAEDLKNEITDIEDLFKSEVELIEVSPPISKAEQEEINASIAIQAANKNEPIWEIDLAQYSVELHLTNNGTDRPYYINSVSSGDATTVFVVVNLDHPFYEGNDLDTANLNLRHVVMDAISEYAAGRLQRVDHTMVNMNKDRFLRLPWKATNL
jgi:hypothetical protein